LNLYFYKIEDHGLAILSFSIKKERKKNKWSAHCSTPIEWE